MKHQESCPGPLAHYIMMPYKQFDTSSSGLLGATDSINCGGDSPNMDVLGDDSDDTDEKSTKGSTQK